jgi:hypothetical protein
MDISEPTALRDHPHVQTVLVRLEKRKLDNSINGEAYRTAKIQILAGLDLALRSKVTMEQSLFDMQDWVQANTMALPFEPIHDVAKHLGEAYTKVQTLSAKVQQAMPRRVTVGISMVKGQEHTLSQIVSSGSFLCDAATVRRRVRGELHPGLVLGEVRSLDHPNRELGNAVREGAFSGCLAVFTYSVIEPGSMLGILGGIATEGSEHEDYQTENVARNERCLEIRAAISCINLNGSKASLGGWVDESSEMEADERILVLDYWRKRNELSYIADARMDPFNPASQIRPPNCERVEILVDGIPYIAVVSSSRIPAHAELLVSEHEAAWAKALRTRDSMRGRDMLARNIADWMHRGELAESLVEPLRQEVQRCTNELRDGRSTVLTMALQWERGAYDEQFGRLIHVHNPGTLPSSVKEALRHYIALQNNESLSAELGETIDMGQSADIEWAVAALYSTLQGKVLDDGFRPRRSVDHDGQVASEHTEEFEALQSKYGERIAKIVTEAWVEQQTHVMLGSRVPWDVQRKQPMTMAQIVEALARTAQKCANEALRLKRRLRRRGGGGGGGGGGGEGGGGGGGGGGDSDDDDAFDDNDDDDDDAFETDGPGAAVNGQLRAMSQPVAKEVAT